MVVLMSFMFCYEEDVHKIYKTIHMTLAVAYVNIYTTGAYF